MRDDEIKKLFDDELRPARAIAAAMDRLGDLMNKPRQPEPSTVPELFFHTKKRRLPDIMECRDCGYQFPREEKCPQCSRANLALFMRAPERREIARVKANREEELTDLDPDWRERFRSDVDLAWDFYKGRPGYVVHSSPFEPPTIIDITDRADEDDVDFDDGLTPDDAR